jgi:hypothetical protein
VRNAAVRAAKHYRKCEKQFAPQQWYLRSKPSKSAGLQQRTTQNVTNRPVCAVLGGSILTLMRVGTELQLAATEVSFMLLAALVLMCPVPQTGDIAKMVHEVPAAVATDDHAAGSVSNPLPSMPPPKEASDASAAASGSGGSTAPAEAIGPHPGPLPLEGVKPAFTRPRETPVQRKTWYALMAVSHGAAAFDAWSTRRAVSQGFVEANPLLAPYAKSNAIYVATQVSPLVMDFIGKRMMTSQHTWIRRMWWLPQAAGSGFSIGAGVHNVRVIH